MQWERVLLPGIPEASEVESFLGVFDIHTCLTQIDTADFTPELILVGGSVSVEFAVRTIELVRQKWKGLRFSFLTADEPNYEPEERHYELFVGAPMTDHHREYCREWREGDWDSLIKDMPLPEFHSRIRSFYQVASPANRTRIHFVGGPHDGLAFEVHGLASEQPPMFFMNNPTGGDKVTYRLDIKEDRVFYQYEEVQNH
jgi:hypothetical protein